jgi:hypothetical protein
MTCTDNNLRWMIPKMKDTNSLLHATKINNGKK